MCELMNDSIGGFVSTTVILIKKKLGGGSRTHITNEAIFTDIIASIKVKVRGDSSKVINAKLMAMKQGNTTAN